MKRKNKNIILITILVTFILINVNITSDMKTYEEAQTINNNISSWNEDSYFSYNNYSNNTISAKEYNNLNILSILITIVTIQIVFYLLFSWFNLLSFNLVFSPFSKLLVYLILSIALTTALVLPQVKSFKSVNNKNSITNKEEDKRDDISYEEVTDKEINLSNYNNNIYLSKSGTYSISGNFNYSIIVNGIGDITLELDNVSIESNNYPTIINKGSNKLKIRLKEDTKSTLTDNGTSSFDSVIYSTGPVVVEGEGTLNINANQSIGIDVYENDLTISSNLNIKAKSYGLVTSGEGGLIDITDGNIYINSSVSNIKSKGSITINGGLIFLSGAESDAPISSDDGYVINNGTLVSLSNDTYETPLKTSKEYSILLKLKDNVSKDTLITLVNSKDKNVLSFTSDIEFNTLVISSKKITKDTYTLYKDGTMEGSSTNNIYTDGTYKKGSLLYKKIEVTSNVTSIQE